MCVCVGCLGEVATGELKSLMEQLRGESLKFHKPGKTEPPEQLEALIFMFVTLFLHASPLEWSKELNLLLSTMQERTIQPRATWSHQTQWPYLKSTWKSLVDRYVFEIS